MSEPKLSERVMLALKICPQGLTAGELSELLKVPYYDAMQTVNGLRAGNKLERRGKHATTRQQIYGLRTAKQSMPADPRLPMLRVGPGERRDDCRAYTGCLGRFCQRHGDKHAHCPELCAHYSPITREAKLHEGSVGGLHPMVSLAES